MSVSELSDRAQRLDDLNTPHFSKFLKLSRQADHLRREIANIRAQGRFTAAIEQHGSPDNAILAAQTELDELASIVEHAKAALQRVNDDRQQMDKALKPVTRSIIDNARRLRERNAALSGERGEIQRSRERRERAIGELMEAGLERELAEQQAKPTVADIEALRCELAAIPGDMERNSALMSSYAGRLELHLADVDSRGDDDDGDAA